MRCSSMHFFFYRVRNRRRSTTRGVTREVLSSAASEVERGRSVRSVAASHGISHVTLNRFVLRKRKLHEQHQGRSPPPLPPVGYSQHKKVFTLEQEQQLVGYLNRAAEICNGLSPKEVRILAFQCAVQFHCSFPCSWSKTQMAGKDWLTAFLKRNQSLFIRKPQAENASFDVLTGEMFFQNLHTLHNRCSFPWNAIWNMDEICQNGAVNPGGSGSSALHQEDSLILPSSDPLLQDLAPEDTGDVECDVCPGTKLTAVKSCLDCLVSYCETHYRLHNEINPGRQHNVIDATSHLQDMICTQHGKALEIFCRTDQSCVCFVCMVGEHKGHDTVTASAERAEKQAQLEETQRTFQHSIQEREQELQQLKATVETLKSSAESALEESERMFAEMLRSIERRCSEVTYLFRCQEKDEVSRAERRQKELEQEVAELKRRNAEMEQLLHTQDHIHFLKTFCSVSDPLESKNLPSIAVSQSLQTSVDALKTYVSTLKEQLEDICKQDISKICAAVSKVQFFLTEPVTREEFLQYSCQFTLDSDTANRHLCLSEENRRVDWRDEFQSYPDHPDRFDGCQVLCREGVSGRCYWEVEWIGDVHIAVSYKSISRKGESSQRWFGWNDQSWSLDVSSSFFRHNNEGTKLPLVASSRIGVYVDHRVGTLAFYSISDTMTLLHKIHTTFTRTLYPGFAFYSIPSSVTLI
ncbi:hypothetical protein ACEWY4_012661 [Coilia grayii]|uniref:Tripartite motif-containing protein 16-like n=1 Tax=Coilia grayii TaxID=363190 RepID=A0ABD1K169_9TELE